MFSGATFVLELMPLCTAVWDNNIRHVEYLLRAGHDVNEKMKLDGRTALFVAVHFNYRHIAALLIHHGAKVNERDNVGMTPLHLACHFCDRDMVKLLLDNKADVNAQTCIKATPILAAANISNVSPAGTDVMGDPYDPYVPYEDHKPIAIAIQIGDPQIVKELQNHGAQIDKEIYSKNKAAARIAHSALELEERKAINDLLRLNLDFLKNVRSNKYDEVKKNIEDGACINVSSERCGSALIYAAWKGYEEIVDLLLDNGADVNFKSATGFTALHMACRFHDDDSIVRKLLRHGAYYNVVDGKTGKTPLIHAGKGVREINTALLYFIHEFFELIGKNDTTILDRLDEMKSLILEVTKEFGPGDYNNFSLLKVAKNDAGETILDIAKKRGFPLLEELEKKLAEL
ncbi:hypothetical protein M8J76_008309 [Diaphorina citri]|nr:hypothetical protein M8J76_008309 [Diaphorina citri]